MKKIQPHLNTYEKVSEDIKFISKSGIRLNILKSLFESPKSPKELTIETGINYSSISRAIHQLIAKDMVYRVNTKYHIVNSLKLVLPNIIELSDIITFLNKIFNILDEHNIESLPKKSIKEISLLLESKLIESVTIEPYKINKYISDALIDANNIKCILPFYEDNIVNKLNNIVSNSSNSAEIKVHSEVFEVYKKNSKVKNISHFNNENNFLIIITNKIMILGFFKNNGDYDQNRILISSSEKSLKWANNLFKNFKANK